MKATLVHKVPKLQMMRIEEPDLDARLRERNPGLFQSLLEAEQIQDQSLRTVIEAFESANYRVEVLAHMDYKGPSEDTDLVIVVGGDGTVLDVSHSTLSTPLIAINSDPTRSVGIFCACAADGAKEAAERFRSGAAVTTTLHRMAVRLNGVSYPIPVMNDVLVTNLHPAMMSRYEIVAGENIERHSSSGMWISTPAGSTGGIRSAGGTVLPISGRMLQYLVREPFTPRGVGYRFGRGVRHLYEGLSLHSLMTGGRIYIDGPFHELPFEMGDTLEIIEGPTLNILDIHSELRGR